MQIIALPTFKKAVKKYLADSDIQELAAMLEANPKAGDVMQGTGGVRKVRWATHAGKSSGLRVIYFFQDHKGQLFLITAFAKNQKDNLTKAERNELKKLTQQLS